MAETTRQLVVRLPVSIMERLDAHVERIRAEAPWSNPNKAMAVRMLLSAALDQVEGKAAPTRGRRR